MFITKKMKEERAQAKRVMGYFICFFAVCTIAMSGLTVVRTFWPKTMATVVASEVERNVSTKRSKPKSHRTSSSGEYKTTSKIDYRLRVDYKYSVDNKEFNTSGIAYHNSDEDKVRTRQRDKYTSGSKFQISYNPSDPTDTDMHSATIFGAIMFLITGLAIGFGGYKLTQVKAPTEVPSENY